MLDDGPVMHAVDRLLKCDDHEAKLIGLYAPARSRVEVITEDAVEAAIRELEGDLAVNDPVDTVEPPPAWAEAPGEA